MFLCKPDENACFCKAACIILFLTTVYSWLRWLTISSWEEAPMLSLQGRRVDCGKLSNHCPQFAYYMSWLPAASSKHTLHLGNTSMSCKNIYIQYCNTIIWSCKLCDCVVYNTIIALTTVCPWFNKTTVSLRKEAPGFILHVRKIRS